MHYALLSPSPQYIIDAAQLVWNTDLLRAFLQAFFAIHTLVGASFGREVLDVLVGKLFLLLIIVGTRLLRQWQHFVVHGLVVECEVSWDVNAIRAWHAVSARGARHGGNSLHGVGNLLE